MTGWQDDRKLRRRLAVWYISLLLAGPHFIKPQFILTAQSPVLFMPNFDRSVGLDCHAGLMYVFEWPKWSEVLMDPWQALWEFDKFFGFVLETILSPLNFIICTTNNGSSPLISSILFFYIFTKHQIKFCKWMISTHYTVKVSVSKQVMIWVVYSKVSLMAPMGVASTS